MMDYIKDLEAKSLSDLEISEFLRHKCRIITYPELYNYDSIEDAMGVYKTLIILYLSKRNYGHWICVFEQTPNDLEFFDSYGGFVDDQFYFINPEFAEDSNQAYPKLSRMMDESHYPNLHYNNKQIQEFDDGVSTCGRHVLCRLSFRDENIDKYLTLISNTKFNPDQLVTLLTFDI